MQKNTPETDHEPLIDKVASKELHYDHGKIKAVDEPVEEAKRHWFRNRFTIISLVGLVLVMAVWAAASIYMSKIRVGNTVVSSRQSNDQLQALVEQQSAAYKLRIAYPNGSTKDYSLQDMGLSVNLDETVQNIRHKQHSLASRLSWWQPVNTYLLLTADNTKRDSFIANHATVTIRPAQDAKLSIHNGVVEITDSTAGKHYGLLNPRDALISAVSGLRSVPLTLATLSTRPAITSAQLAPYQTLLQNILKQSVVFTLNSKQFTASSDDIANWVEIAQDTNGKKIDVTVNSGKVLAYIDKIAAPYVHQPKSQVEFSRDDGTVTILSDGADGTAIADKNEIAATIAKNLLADKAINQPLSVQHSAFTTVDANDYDKWIEVDLTNKIMYTYEKSTLVKTFLISGGAPATPTVTGQYKIYAKYEQQDMRGLNVDGTSYFQPHVAWVNYFYQGYAIHGNYWRPLYWFGKYNSSHGCVSLPDDLAQWVYSWAPIGTPVIIHN